MNILLEPKRSDEVRRYRHDWAPFLGDDTIVSETTVSTVVAIDDSDIDAGDQSVTFTVSGGTDGETAVITHSIVTAAGDEETTIFLLQIGEGEPVSLSEAKAQCRMAEDDSQDGFIASLIPSARAYVERVAGYALVAATRTESFKRWGDFIELSRRPIASIETLAYIDEAGEAAEYEGFLASLGGYPVRIYPGVDDSFPALASGGEITVTYTVSAVAATSEEYLIAKRAILLLIGHWFENREAAVIGSASSEVDLAVCSLLDTLRPVSAY